jgi:hypothetical protein
MGFVIRELLAAGLAHGDVIGVGERRGMARRRVSTRIFFAR